MRHASSQALVVPVARAGRGQRALADDVRVLDGVHVDRLAVGVRRPAACRRADGAAAVEAGGVVRGHRGGVAAAVGVDGHHAPDREAHPVEPPEHRGHLAGYAPAHDQSAGVRPTVEPPVRQPHEAQFGGGDRAAGAVGVTQVHARRLTPPRKGGGGAAADAAPSASAVAASSATTRTVERVTWRSVLLATLLAALVPAVCPPNPATAVLPQPTGSQLLTVEAASARTSYATLRMWRRRTAAGRAPAGRTPRVSAGTGSGANGARATARRRSAPSASVP